MVFSYKDNMPKLVKFCLEKLLCKLRLSPCGLLINELLKPFIEVIVNISTSKIEKLREEIVWICTDSK